MDMALPWLDGTGLRPVDRRSTIPFYYQLQEILKEEIEDGRWQPGELLPSEARLGLMFKVSRTVIRQALDVLEADGQVLRVKGKGTVVAEPKFRYEAVAAAHDHTQPEVDATASLARILDVRLVSAGGQIGRLLQVTANEDLFEVTVVHAVGPTPASLVQMFLRVDSSARMRQAATDQNLQLQVAGPDLLAQLTDSYGVAIVESQLTVEATRANDFEAEMLGLPLGTPMFLLSSVELAPDDVPVAFTRSVVRSDQFRFSLVLRRRGQQGRSIRSIPFLDRTG
jgi:GntR family transcriptional regulator, N-acetylglucosamine utilization regulator